MNPSLEAYIKNLISNKPKQENKVDIKIPVLYAFTYKELYCFISNLVPNKQVNLVDNNLSSSRYNMAYDFRIEII